MSDKLYDTIFRINCLSEDINSLYHQAALKLGVPDSVLFVLYMIYTNGGQCLLSDIYKSYGISKQTINSAIRKLEGEDIVFLEKHNGKAKTVCLTENGKPYINENAAKLFDAECSAFGGWSEEEMDLYLSLIQKHNASLRSQIQNL